MCDYNTNRTKATANKLLSKKLLAIIIKSKSLSGLNSFLNYNSQW